MRNLKKTIMAIAASLIISTGAAMAFDLPGLKAGDNIPAISAADQDGTSQNWDSLRGEKGAVMIFVRSADWCPFCKIQMIDLQNRAAEINDKGYSIVTVSYDPVADLKTFDNRYKVDYTMLSDPDSKLIAAFGILNETIEQDSDWYGIPYPAVYIVNPEGVIQARFGEEGHRERPQVDAILAKIEALAG